MTHKPIFLTTLLAVALTTLAGCSADRTRIVVHEDATAPASVARIGHLVFISLKDPADTAELIESSREELADIPGITAFGVGTHLETGREAVDQAYDVALYLGFETEADYAAYVVHPSHVAYVEAWMPRVDGLRIFDVLED